jgi:hypothetical protein
MENELQHSFGAQCSLHISVLFINGNVHLIWQI